MRAGLRRVRPRRRDPAPSRRSSARLAAATLQVLEHGRERPRWTRCSSRGSTSSSAARLQVALLVAAGVLDRRVPVHRLLPLHAPRRAAQISDRLESLRDHCVADLSAALAAMTDGDLTVEVMPVTPPITDISRDELGEVAIAVNTIRESTVGSIDAYNAMRESLAELIGTVSLQRRHGVGGVAADGGDVAGDGPRRGRHRRGRQRRGAGGGASGEARRVDPHRRAGGGARGRAPARPPRGRRPRPPRACAGRRG